MPQVWLRLDREEAEAPGEVRPLRERPLVQAAGAQRGLPPLWFT